MGAGRILLIADARRRRRLAVGAAFAELGNQNAVLSCHGPRLPNSPPLVHPARPGAGSVLRGAELVPSELGGVRQHSAHQRTKIGPAADGLAPERVTKR